MDWNLSMTDSPAAFSINGVRDRRRIELLQNHLLWELEYDRTELLHAEFDCDICATIINYVRNFDSAYKTATGEERQFEEILAESEHTASELE